MKPFPFKLQKPNVGITINVKVPRGTPYDGDGIFVRFNKSLNKEPILCIGCQEHTLSEWLKDGEKIITEEMEVRYGAEDLDVDHVAQRQVLRVIVQHLRARPAELASGQEWKADVWFNNGSGYLCTPRPAEDIRADAEKRVADRKAAMRKAEKDIERAMVTLPLLIAAVQDELRAHGVSW